MRPKIRTGAMGVFLALLVLVSMSVPATAHGGGATEGTVIEITDSGNAHITFTYTYSLANDSERQAFTHLQNNTTAKNNLETKLTNGIKSAISNANTDRNITVTGTELALHTANKSDGKVGVVQFTAEISNFAKKSGDKLVIGSLLDGYQPFGEVRVVAPDGYKISKVSPDPTAVVNNNVVWTDTDALTNFSVVMEQKNTNQSTSDSSNSDNSGSNSSSGSLPGFGILTGASAVALAGALLAFRRKD